MLCWAWGTFEEAQLVYPGGAPRVVGSLPWGQPSTEQCVTSFDRGNTEAVGTEQA